MLSRALAPALRQVVRVNLGSPITRGFGTSPSRLDSVVTYQQLKTMLSSHNVQLFDVRSPDEFRDGHIPHSTSIPLDHLGESLKLSPKDFKLIFQVEAPGKDDNNIVFYCRSGNRSAKALDVVHQLGFNRARHFKGGYSEWVTHEGK